MGIKRRRRETAIAEGKKPLTTRGSSGSRTSQTGGPNLTGIFERPFFTRLPAKFLISPKNFFLFFFFFFSHRPFLCFNLLLVCQCYNSNKILGGLNPSFKLSSQTYSKKIMYHPWNFGGLNSY